MINLIKLWSQNFFASKKSNQVPSNLFFIFSNSTWVVIFSRITTDFKYKLSQNLKSLNLHAPDEENLVHLCWAGYAIVLCTMVLALPDFFRCPPPLYCLPSKLAFRLHCCSRTQSDRLEGKQHFLLPFA